MSTGKRRDKLLAVGVAVSVHAGVFVGMAEDISSGVAAGAGGGLAAIGMIDFAATAGIVGAVQAAMPNAPVVDAAAVETMSVEAPTDIPGDVAHSTAPRPEAAAVAAETAPEAATLSPLSAVEASTLADALVVGPAQQPVPVPLPDTAVAKAVEVVEAPPPRPPPPSEVKAIDPIEVETAAPARMPTPPRRTNDVLAVEAKEQREAARAARAEAARTARAEASRAQSASPAKRAAADVGAQAEASRAQSAAPAKQAAADGGGQAEAVAADQTGGGDADSGAASAQAGGQGGQQLASIQGNTNDQDARQAYAALVRGILERKKRYPGRARARGREGIAVVQFTVARSGQVSAVSLSKRSGVAALDRETLEMLSRAGRLPPIPENIGGDSLTFVFPVAFSLR